MTTTKHVPDDDGHGHSNDELNPSGFGLKNDECSAASPHAVTPDSGAPSERQRKKHPANLELKDDIDTALSIDSTSCATASYLQAVVQAVEQAQQDATNHSAGQQHNEQESTQMILSELRNIHNVVLEAQRNVNGVVDKDPNIRRGMAWFAVVAFVLTFSQWHGLVAAVPKGSDEVYCWDLSSMFGLVWATGRVWIGAELARRKMLPALFPRTHAVMAGNRKIKAVGNLIKATARLGAMCFMTALWWKFDMTNGLDMNYGEGHSSTVLLFDSDSLCLINSCAQSRRPACLLRG